MTFRVNAMRQTKFYFSIFVSIFILHSTDNFGMSAPEIKLESAETIATQVADEEREESKTEATSITRRIQLLQIASPMNNFRFNSFSSHWITTEKDWIQFWSTYSRVSGPAPKLPVNWKSEALLALFWEGKDQIVRIPSFMGTEEIQKGSAKTLRLHFNLNQPCFGIISDASPSQFVIVDYGIGDVDAISIRAENTQSIGCF